jgi:hypothetical protein
MNHKNDQTGGNMSQIEATQTDKPVHEKFYTIQGQKFRQTELNIGEDIALIKTFKSSLVGENPDTMFESLLDMENLEKWIKIILKGDLDAIEIKKISNTHLQEVLADFFLLNRKMINNFISLGIFLSNPNAMSQANGQEKSTT